MKRIALVSPHNEYNYGTVLQAYALQQIIEKHGYLAEYLCFSNVIPSPLWKRICNKIYSLLKKIIKNNTHTGLDDYSFFYSPEFEEYAKGFEHFINVKIKESSVIYTPISLPSSTEYVAYLVGSDQTWGEARTKKNPLFLGHLQNPVLKN